MGEIFDTERIEKTVKKILISTLSVMLAFPISASCAGISGWAVPEYENISAVGLIPNSIVSEKLTESVTREEFCDIVVNLYNKISEKEATFDKMPFWDTKSESVAKAYALGIVNGKDVHYFHPNDFITRQEMAKMVMKTINAADKNANVTVEDIEKLAAFEDFHETDGWAREHLAGSIKYDIINGVSKNRVAPKGYATREQAVAIINRAYEKFCDQKSKYTIPTPADIYDGITLFGGFSFSWNEVAGADGYEIILKDANENYLKSYTSKTNSFTITDMVYNRKYYITIGAKMSDKSIVYSVPCEVFFGIGSSSAGETLSLWQKQNKVFPNGVAFKTQQEADANMKLISFPVWRLGTNGKKYSDTEKLMVNKNIADDVIKIFVNIYRSDERFPIKNVGGYSWRQTAFGSVSQHSYGTCIDINFDENYYAYNTGEAITGSFWKPYENPYSMTPDGSVVTEFKKFGFTWGGDWKNIKDYMHFSYLGK